MWCYCIYIAVRRVVYQEALSIIHCLEVQIVFNVLVRNSLVPTKLWIHHGLATSPSLQLPRSSHAQITHSQKKTIKIMGLKSCEASNRMKHALSIYTMKELPMNICLHVIKSSHLFQILRMTCTKFQLFINVRIDELLSILDAPLDIAQIYHVLLIQDTLFVEREQDLKEMSSFVSWSSNII